MDKATCEHCHEPIQRTSKHNAWRHANNSVFCPTRTRDSEGYWHSAEPSDAYYERKARCQ